MSTVLAVCNQISVDILCGKYDDDKMLPTERELAALYGVGRPTVHAALVKLQSQGLIRTIPRHGWEILDLKRHGKLDLMTLALSMPMEDVSMSFAKDALSLFIVSTKDIVETILVSGFNDFEVMDFLALIHVSEGDAIFAESVFHFYQRLAMRSENSVYSLVMNQFKSGVLNAANVASQNERYQFKSLIEELLLCMAQGDDQKAVAANREAAWYLFNLWANRKETL